MTLKDKIPDDGERVDFVRDFFMTMAKAMRDLRESAHNMTEDELAEFVEARLRPVVGDDFHLSRDQLLVLARYVQEDRGLDSAPPTL